MAWAVRSVMPGGGADVADPGLGVAGDLHQHVPVPGQQRPAAAALVRKTHTPLSYILARNHARTFTREYSRERITAKFFSCFY